MSHPDGMSQPHCETYKDGEWSLLAFSVNLFFKVSEKSESGANPPADIVVVGREWGGRVEGGDAFNHQKKRFLF